MIATSLALAPAIVGPPLDESERAALRQRIWRDLGMPEVAWSTFAAGIAAAHSEAAAFLNITISPGSAMDLYAEAQEEAARVGIVAQLERTRATNDAEELFRRATTDALTGVANRARFDERLAEMARGLSREHGTFALIMLDIDHFKTFNDTHGHQVGDLVLSRVARAVQNSLREVDLSARYGGEEFVILAPATERDGACMIAARAQKCIEALRVQVHGRVLSITASLGVAVTKDFPAAPTPAHIISEADKQLYFAKSAGRNTWCYRGTTGARHAAPEQAA